MDPAIGRALTLIHRDPGRAWSVEEMARAAGLSRSSFADRFARLVGVTPGRFVTERCLAHAEHLLRSTALAVGAVAVRVGYASEGSFSRAFATHRGTSPSKYRSALVE